MWSRELLRSIYDEIQKAARDVVKGFTRGGNLDYSTPNAVGHVPTGRGGTGHDQGAEPPLPAPPGPGYLLTSAGDGTYGWLQLIAGAGITIDINPTTGSITIGTTLALDTLVWDGDDLTFGGSTLAWGES